MRKRLTLVLIGVSALGARCDRGDAAERAKNAVVVEEYSRELDLCIARGKEAGSLEVYETCARAADTKYGYDGGRR